jgi:hypothetical protein
LDKTITIPAFNAGLLNFNLGLHFVVTGTLIADAGIEVTKVGSSVVFDPSGTFVTLTPSLTTKVDASMPLEVGPWRVIDPKISLDATFTVILEAHWSGPLTSPAISSYKLKGTLSGHYDYDIVFGKDKKTGDVTKTKDEMNTKEETDKGIPFGPYTLFDIPPDP